MKFSFDAPAIIDVGDIVDYYSIIRRRLAVRFIDSSQKSRFLDSAVPKILC